MSEKVADSVVSPKSFLADPLGLSEALRAQVRGDVRFDNSSRALYAADGSNYRQVPIGVVLPRDADDVLQRARHPCGGFRFEIGSHGNQQPAAGA